MLYVVTYLPTVMFLICFILYYFFIGLDAKSEACQRFFQDVLTVSFTKILMDEALSGWKFEIHVSFCKGDLV